MVHFLNGYLLIWAALAAVPIALYLFRPKPQTVRVSTLPFFQNLVRAHQESAWLRRLKQLLSLLLSLLFILAGTAALARLVFSPPAQSLKTAVIVVDRSASMQARDARGQTLLEKARAQVDARLAALPADVGVILMTYDRQPEILLSRSFDRRAIRRELAAIQPRPIAGEPARALVLAARLAAIESPAVVWHIGDQHFELAAPDKPSAEPNASSTTAAPAEENLPSGLLAVDLPSDVTFESLVVAHPQAANAGITALDLRPMPQQRLKFEAFVQLQGTIERPTPVELEISLDGTLVELRRLTLAAGTRERLLVPIDASAEHERMFAVRLKMEGDALEADNAAQAIVPRVQPLTVTWISAARDPFTSLALGTLGDGHEVFAGDPKAWPPQKMPDLVIFDGWLPEKWPATLPVIVINPPRSAGPLRVVRLEGHGLPIEQVRAAQPGHPLLYGVANDRLSLTQTSVLDTSGTLEPLWIGPTGEPLLLAGEAGGQRLVVMSFEPGRSENLELQASYPLLIGNAIYWASEPRFRQISAQCYRTGDLVEVSAKEIRWSDATSGAAPSSIAKPVAGHWIELDRIGTWHADDRTGTASLLSPQESLAVGGKDSQDKMAVVQRSWLAGDLTPTLLWLMVGVLLVENWLFHRRAVY